MAYKPKPKANKKRLTEHPKVYEATFRCHSQIVIELSNDKTSILSPPYKINIVLKVRKY